jgi:hypothetical protein
LPWRTKCRRRFFASFQVSEQDVKRAFFSAFSIPGVSWVELRTWGPEAIRRVFPDGLGVTLSAGVLTPEAAKRLERERRRQSFRVIRGGKADPRKIRELLGEYASLIQLAGDVPPENKARMRDLERKLLTLGCILDLDLDLLVV